VGNILLQVISLINN